MRDRHRLSKFCLRHGRRLPTSSWSVAAAQVAFRAALRASPRSSRPSTPTCTRSTSSTRGSSSWSARSATTAEQEPWRELVARLRCLRGIDTLTALALVSEIGDFSRFRTAEELMAFVGLVPSERSSRRAAPAGIDHQGRQQPRPSAPGRVGLARAPTADGRLRARPPPARPGRRRDRARLALPATAVPALAADGRPRQTPAEDRRRLRPRARRLRLGDRERATTPNHLTHTSLSALSSGCVQPHGEPSKPLCGTAPVTRDARPRQLRTVPSHAVPTGECQSDPPSLPRTIRCSRPRGQPPNRASPLDDSLHVRGPRRSSPRGRPGSPRRAPPRASARAHRSPAAPRRCPRRRSAPR